MTVKNNSTNNEKTWLINAMKVNECVLLKVTEIELIK